MDRIAPAGTIIVCDYEDRQPVDGKFYVLKIGGEITFKRYRANPDRFEPYSFGAEHETIFPDDSAEIVGRVVFVTREI